ncbi:MTH538 TIR-like domain [Lachnospiraceae bacterium]|nr:MTH538 TIR-like domain [Lachnospiraceae bacterium]
MSKSQHYNAFISYRHSKLDSSVAISLHRKLERFRLPGNLRKDYPKDKWKIERVFRDEDELPLADNLSDPIEEALKNSDFLIVICTPRLPESKWCAKEIETFKKLHGQDHILAVLAEGEPDDSFPDAICYKEIEKIDENGKSTVERVSIEPLAADVRSDDPRKRNKMLDDAVLRMAAPMYGLGYDDLKQRHREQRIKRIASVSALAAGVFFIFGMICMILGLKINAQKNLIAEQHVKLEKQYREEQIKYAESMAVVTDTLLKEGLRQDAVYAVRNAMPDTINDETVPYVPSTQYALSKALGKYTMYNYVPIGKEELPENDDFWNDPGKYRTLESSLADQYVIMAEERGDSKVIILTSSCRLYLYDPAENLLLDYTYTWFSDPPTEYVLGAAIKDNRLYIWFSDADYMAVYEWIGIEEYKKAGSINYEDRREKIGTRIEDGEEVVSDDGKYIMTTGPNHTLLLKNAETKENVKTLYDMRGGYTALKELSGIGGYMLVSDGKYSYQLDQDLNIIAEVPYFYDYDADNKAFFQYYYVSDAQDYDLYSVKTVSYDSLIKEADELLSDYHPSEEVLDRYGMMREK